MCGAAVCSPAKETGWNIAQGEPYRQCTDTDQFVDCAPNFLPTLPHHIDYGGDHHLAGGKHLDVLPHQGTIESCTCNCSELLHEWGEFCRGLVFAGMMNRGVRFREAPFRAAGFVGIARRLIVGRGGR